MAYVTQHAAVHVTIFSAGGKFRPVSNLPSYKLLLQLPVLMGSCHVEPGCWQSYLPPVSNASSEGGEVGEHPVISHHVREEGTVGATSTEAVTY